MNRLFTFCIAVLLLASCAPKLTYTWTKKDYEPRDFKKIAVFSYSKSLSVSGEFQNDMVKYLTAEGYNAVSGLSILNPNQMKDLDSAAVKQILIKEGVDVVISAIVVDRETTTNYVQDANMSMGYGYGYPYGGFGAYYGYRYGPAYYNTGHYQESKTYLIENHVYEIIAGESNEEALLWASQSSITDPGSSTPKVYSKVLIRALKEDGILK